MLTNTLLKWWLSNFLDCFLARMLAQHSLFTSATFIPLEGHTCAWQPHLTISANVIAQNSVHFLWKVLFMTSQDFFPMTSMAYTPMDHKSSKVSPPPWHKNLKQSVFWSGKTVCAKQNARLHHEDFWSAWTTAIIGKQANGNFLS